MSSIQSRSGRSVLSRWSLGLYPSSEHTTRVEAIEAETMLSWRGLLLPGIELGVLSWFSVFPNACLSTIWDDSRVSTTVAPSLTASPTPPSTQSTAVPEPTNPGEREASQLAILARYHRHACTARLAAWTRVRNLSAYSAYPSYRWMARVETNTWFSSTCPRPPLEFLLWFPHPLDTSPFWTLASHAVDLLPWPTQLSLTFFSALESMLMRMVTPANETRPPSLASPSPSASIRWWLTHRHAIDLSAWARQMPLQLNDAIGKREQMDLDEWTGCSDALPVAIFPCLFLAMTYFVSTWQALSSSSSPITAPVSKDMVRERIVTEWGKRRQSNRWTAILTEFSALPSPIPRAHPSYPLDALAHPLRSWASYLDAVVPKQGWLTASTLDRWVVDARRDHERRNVIVSTTEQGATPRSSVSHPHMLPVVIESSERHDSAWSSTDLLRWIRDCPSPLSVDEFRAVLPSTVSPVCFDAWVTLVQWASMEFFSCFSSRTPCPTFSGVDSSSSDRLAIPADRWKLACASIQAQWEHVAPLLPACPSPHCAQRCPEINSSQRQTPHIPDGPSLFFSLFSRVGHRSMGFTPQETDSTPPEIVLRRSVNGRGLHRARHGGGRQNG